MKIKKTIVLALVFAACASFAEFSAGFARVDATPPLGIPITGYFCKRIADGVLDPLYIDCVAVSDGTNTALVYCVDALSLSNPFVKKAFPAIKERSPFRMTIVTCLTNGSEGYIPSTKAHPEGGYEALSSRFAAPAGDRLVEAQLNQLTALNGNAICTKPNH